MKFTMNRDRTVVSDFGHSVEFQKGVPTYVPPEMYALVQQHGADPEEDIPEPAAHTPPDATAEREQMILMAIDSIVTRAKADEFTQTGAPHTRALAAELGWRVSNQERDALWAKFLADKAT